MVRGLSQLDVGRAFIGGVGIVIIAIYLDRVTRSLGRSPQQRGGIGRRLRLGKKGASKVLPGTRADRDTVGAGADKEADAEDGSR